MLSKTQTRLEEKNAAWKTRILMKLPLYMPAVQLMFCSEEHNIHQQEKKSSIINSMPLGIAHLGVISLEMSPNKNSNVAWDMVFVHSNWTQWKKG